MALDPSTTLAESHPLADPTSHTVLALSLPVEATRTEADTKVGLLEAAGAMDELRDATLMMSLITERQPDKSLRSREEN